MSSNAWIFQKPKDVRELGDDKATWYAGWYEPSGKRTSKSCGAGFRGRKRAEKLQQQIEDQLANGTYKSHVKKTWAEFREELDTKILNGMEPATRRLTMDALAHFERIAKPVRVRGIDSQTFADYIAARRKEAGKKRGSVISVATVNKELRHIKAVLKIAVDWGYLPAVPRFKMIREPVKLPNYVTGDHFAAIYGACDHAKRPELPNVSAADWWRALLVTGFMTGWRISEILALRRDDLDLEQAFAITRAADNKGKRDDRVKLHPVVITHLEKLAGFSPVVFPWNHDERSLYSEFARIQEAAGIHLPCDDEHEHSRFCFVYGFHDLRRAFATMNADKLSADALQKLMRHKSYLTTQKYINLARQMDAAVASLHVPDILNKREA